MNNSTATVVGPSLVDQTRAARRARMEHVQRPVTDEPRGDAKRIVEQAKGKNRHGRNRRILFCFLATLLNACSQKTSQSAKPSESPVVVSEPTLARCIAAEGSVQIRRGEAEYDDIVIGESLRAGNRIKTGALSYLHLDLASSGELQVAESTVLELQELNADGNSPASPVVSFETGAAYGIFDKQGSGGARRLWIRFSPSSPLTIEATGAEPFRFRVTKIKNGAQIASLQGQGLLRVAGNEKPLKAGEEVDVVNNEMGPVRSLPAPPSWGLPTADSRFFYAGLIVRLEWQAVDNASGYHVQVSNDPTFQSLAWNADTLSNHAPWVPRTAGRYFWRVATRDAESHLGDFGESRTLFCETEPPSDHLVTPVEGAVARLFVEAPGLVFRWQPWPGAKGYRLAVAQKGENKTAETIHRTTTETQIVVNGLAGGEYEWGVFVDEPSGQPLFLKPRKLTILRLQVKTPKTLQWGG